MGIDRPSDVAVIVGVGLLVILTIGLGITSVQENQGVTETSTVFRNANDSGINMYTNVSNTAGGALANSPGASNNPSETNIATASFNAILGLGGMISDSINLMSDFQDAIGIPDYFVKILVSIILVVFAVVTYSWFRGTQLP